MALVLCLKASLPVALAFWSNLKNVILDILSHLIITRRKPLFEAGDSIFLLKRWAEVAPMVRGYRVLGSTLTSKRVNFLNQNSWGRDELLHKEI